MTGWIGCTGFSELENDAQDSVSHVIPISAALTSVQTVSSANSQTPSSLPVIATELEAEAEVQQ